MTSTIECPECGHLIHAGEQDTQESQPSLLSDATMDNLIYVTMKDIVRMSGLSYGTVRTYRWSGKLPKEERTILGGPAWRRSTIVNWLAAGKGADK